jgi:hypothetical protein
MPKIDKILSLEITPEQFLNACSPNELQEIYLLIQSSRYWYEFNPDPTHPSKDDRLGLEWQD